MSFDRLGRVAVRRRWWIVAVWAVILLAALPFAPQAPGALSAGGFILDDLESARARQVLQEELGAEPSAFVLVYSSDTLKAGTREWLAQGRTRHLGGEDLAVAVTAEWTSPATGATYPAGWTITLPDEELEIRLSPTVPQQELDTCATTGVVYWEGSQRVAATRAGSPPRGQAYVELTGYAPSPALP